MGEYYVVANLDKKQYIHPHRFDTGMKLGEIALNAKGASGALILLLAQGDRRMGDWRGDRIVVVGDYDDSGLYETVQDEYEDISKKVIEQLRSEDWDMFHYKE